MPTAQDSERVMISAPPSVLEAANQAFGVNRVHIELYSKGETGLLSQILKEEKEKNSESKQGSATGRKLHPFNMSVVRNFMNANVHHARCIKAKVAATVGLGFMSEEQRKAKGKPAAAEGAAGAEPSPVKVQEITSKAETILDPLCEHTFAETFNDCIEDYWNLGTGYIEVVRAPDRKRIIGLYHLPCPDVYVHVDDEMKNSSYEVLGLDGLKHNLRWAKFGDWEAMVKRNDLETSKDGVSEVIAFRQSTSLSRYYGYPDWLSATPHIEVTQCVHQHVYDFFLNRGVPEYMLFILGSKMDKPDWTKVEDALRSNVGLGNSHKSLALNLANPNITVQLEKLAMEGKSDEMVIGLKDNLAMDIVSAHGVPPLLAGIQIPGKLGATNELPNALMAFQVLVIGQAQKAITQTLGKTLGHKEYGVGGLTVEDFRFNTIIDHIDIGQMDTVGRMRETVPEAKAKGRDLKAGVKD